MTKFSSRDDLRQWLNDRMTSDATNGDILAVVDAIAADHDRPRYGADWSAYLETLPDRLMDMAY